MKQLTTPKWHWTTLEMMQQLLMIFWTLHKRLTGLMTMMTVINNESEYHGNMT